MNFFQKETGFVPEQYLNISSVKIVNNTIEKMVKKGQATSFTPSIISTVYKRMIA